VFRELRREDALVTRLLYITPERIAQRGALWSCLESLYQRDRLARFVIDEACAHTPRRSKRWMLNDHDAAKQLMAVWLL